MPSKTERTVVALGGSCIMALPKHWVTGMGLKPGDKLEVVYDEDVIVRVKKQPDNKEPEK